ncbi:hypothetical protein, partial [Methylobacter sp.]|uniref:hypothetical protein n=1 Tax=Methylobacter sp. TaxID=2051955 RepID=UPI0025E599BC
FLFLQNKPNFHNDKLAIFIDFMLAFSYPGMRHALGKIYRHSNETRFKQSMGGWLPLSTPAVYQLSGKPFGCYR